MAFTLRLNPTQERALDRLAKHHGVSKSEAVRRAIMLAANHGTSHPRLVKAATQRVLDRDARLLERLGDG